MQEAVLRPSASREPASHSAARPRGARARHRLRPGGAHAAASALIAGTAVWVLPSTAIAFQAPYLASLALGARVSDGKRRRAGAHPARAALTLIRDNPVRL
jgi:hypothetical protein